MATSTAVSSWQTGKNLMQCTEHVFRTRTDTDVRFLVGEHKTAVDAHCFILIIRSEVFHQMFTGELREQSHIKIPDVQAEIFSEFLKYLYTDDVVLTGDNVTGLLYLSRKYIITTLEDRCAKYLESSLSSQNACVVLEQAHLFDEHDLRKKTLDYILKNGDEVLKSDEVTDLCHKCLVQIVRADELAADEKNVFEAAVKWADSACRKQGKKTSEKNIREALGEVVKHVRYPLLDQTYFLKHVTPTHILTITEELKITKHFLCRDEDVSPFNSKVRSKREEKKIFKNLLRSGEESSPFNSNMRTKREEKKIIKNVLRSGEESSPFNSNMRTKREERKIFEKLLRSGEDVSPFNSNMRTAVIRKTQITINRFGTYTGGLSGAWVWYGNSDEAITFSVNKNALLRGFQLYGYDLPQDYHVSAVVTDTRTGEVLDGSTLTHWYRHVVCVVYDVLFRRPVKITKDTVYTLFVNGKGGVSWRGRECKSKIVVDSFVCRFSKPVLTDGQIPALLFLV